MRTQIFSALLKCLANEWPCKLVTINSKCEYFICWDGKRHLLWILNRKNVGNVALNTCSVYNIDSRVNRRNRWPNRFECHCYRSPISQGKKLLLNIWGGFAVFILYCNTEYFHGAPKLSVMSARVVFVQDSRATGNFIIFQIPCVCNGVVNMGRLLVCWVSHVHVETDPNFIRFSLATKSRGGSGLYVVQFVCS